MGKVFVFLIALAVFMQSASAGIFGPDVEPVGLRCEYLENPVGIDQLSSRLSWKLETGNRKPERGIKQTAFRVLVATSEDLLKEGKADLWDSGKVESDQSVNVEYAGKPLESRMECYWKVKVWVREKAEGGDLSRAERDSLTQRRQERSGKPEKEEATGWSKAGTWTIGLLKPDDFKGKWIRAPKVPAKKVALVKAQYATLDGSISKDVTEQVAALVKEGRLTFKVEAGLLGGDPAPGKLKELKVVYEVDGKQSEESVKDFDEIVLVQTGAQSPWLRKTFELKSVPDELTAYVESRGYHELWVNGKKVGENVLTPATSVLNKRSFYVTYNIAPMLRKGRNTVGIWLGRGWNTCKTPGITDDRPIVRFQAALDEDGERMLLVSDESWKASPSPYLTLDKWEWNQFGGECFDARLANDKWCSPEQDEAGWAQVELPEKPAARTEYHIAPLNRIGKRFTPVKCTQLNTSLWEIDFGTNMTGWVDVKFPKLQSGQKVSLYFADRRYQTPGGDDTPAGHIKLMCSHKIFRAVTNDICYQTFNHMDRFISAGKEGESFCCKFNYHGFRYLIIEGMTEKPDLNNVQAMLVESDLESAGSFECSNEMLNRIYAADHWTLRCLNLGGYMVDCPHRERFGYGDGQVSMEMCLMSWNMAGLYSKWAVDWADVQHPSGWLPGATPWTTEEMVPSWGGIMLSLAWQQYLYYGDKQTAMRVFDAGRRWMDYTQTRTTNSIYYGPDNPWACLGDWVAPGRGMDGEWPPRNAQNFFNNCYLVYILEVQAKIAETTGRIDEAVKCRTMAEKLRPIVHNHFYNSTNGFYQLDEQAYYVMPLMTGVAPSELKPALLKRLDDGIMIKRKGHLDTGMLGTVFMLRYLSSIGRDDLIFTMMTQKDYPGWGYMLEQGATTLWEQWNGFWSNIHSCFTGPGGWMYQGLAGILPDETGPGFKKFIIKPKVVGDVTWVKCHYDSMHGRIVSNWKREGQKLTMDVVIPPNTTATIFVPAIEKDRVTESGKSIEKAKGVKFLNVQDGRAVFEVGSGSYCFSSEMVK